MFWGCCAGGVCGVIRCACRVCGGGVGSMGGSSLGVSVWGRRRGRHHEGQGSMRSGEKMAEWEDGKAAWRTLGVRREGA